MDRPARPPPQQFAFPDGRMNRVPRHVRDAFTALRARLTHPPPPP
jgi:hypothetical protein